MNFYSSNYKRETFLRRIIVFKDRQNQIKLLANDLKWLLVFPCYQLEIKNQVMIESCLHDINLTVLRRWKQEVRAFATSLSRRIGRDVCVYTASVLKRFIQEVHTCAASISVVTSGVAICVTSVCSQVLSAALACSNFNLPVRPHVSRSTYMYIEHELVCFLVKTRQVRQKSFLLMPESDDLFTVVSRRCRDNFRCGCAVTSSISCDATSSDRAGVRSIVCDEWDIVVHSL